MLLYHYIQQWCHCIITSQSDVIVALHPTLVSFYPYNPKWCQCIITINSGFGVSLQSAMVPAPLNRVTWIYNAIEMLLLLLLFYYNGVIVSLHLTVVSLQSTVMSMCHYIHCIISTKQSLLLLHIPVKLVCRPEQFWIMISFSKRSCWNPQNYRIIAQKHSTSTPKPKIWFGLGCSPYFTVLKVATIEQSCHHVATFNSDVI